jgi:CRISPR system Cascade subunit CasA
MTFNLIHEPWIPVLTRDNQVKNVSLTELFETWESLREIQAENPPTILALYRFLLAILHRAYEGPRNTDHWADIFEDNGTGAIAYLNAKRDRFDLLHPDHPFMQDPALPLDKAVPIYALHTMSTSQVFSHEHEWSGYRLALPDAARLLVRLQGVDITSLRAFYVGQSSGNRSAVNTPTINAANVLVQGKTLKQLLMFNLMRYDPSSEIPSALLGEDLPTWETGYAGKPKKAVPQGYISYLTFPWRRLRLFVENGKVSQIAITMGNSLPDQISSQQWECGVAYRNDKPVRLSLRKQLWRDADSFLLSTEAVSRLPGANTYKRPPIVNWLAELQVEDWVDDLVTLGVIGLCADKAKPLGWSVEQFSVPRVYLTDPDLEIALTTAIAIAESHRRVFGSAKGSPYFALADALKNGNAAGLATTLDGESRYWATLDRQVLEFLYALPHDCETEADGVTYYGSKTLPAWTQTVQTAARQAFIESIASIRNYQARAQALRTLERHLRKLRGDDTHTQDDKTVA